MSMIRRFWDFLKADTFASWLVSLLLIFLLIKFIVFPLISLIAGTSLPLVVVESCSMHHNGDFDSWWDQNGAWYEKQGIEKEQFESFPLKNGFTKGDIILVTSAKGIEEGDVIIFAGGTRYPIIHRVMGTSPLQTKGDNNLEQLSIEKAISGDAVFGKAVARVPFIGWVKLIFFDPFKPASQRGLC